MFRSLRVRMAPPPPATKPAPKTTQSVIGTGAKFSGTLETGGDVRIDGTFDGDITAKGNVVIDEAGKVEGDVQGKSLVIGGTVRGDVEAKRISVLSTGRVWGDLITGLLTTQEGGFIQGVITMHVESEETEVTELAEELEAQVAEVVEGKSKKK